LSSYSSSSIDSIPDSTLTPTTSFFNQNVAPKRPSPSWATPRWNLPGIIAVGANKRDRKKEKKQFISPVIVSIEQSHPPRPLRLCVRLFDD
jgi:hypothetical protein